MQLITFRLVVQQGWVDANLADDLPVSQQMYPTSESQRYEGADLMSASLQQPLQYSKL